jgi:hypothetical protein
MFGEWKFAEHALTEAPIRIAPVLRFPAAYGGVGLRRRPLRRCKIFEQ